MESAFELLEAGKMIGRQQAFAVIASKCTAAQAVTLKELRESRAYEKLGLDWEHFCVEQVGLSREQADRIIRQLEELGASYFQLSQLVRVSPDFYRQLADKVKDDAIEIDGEPVALTLPNAPRIRAAVKRLRKELTETRESLRQPPTPELTAFVRRIEALVDDAGQLIRTCAVAGRIHELRAVVNHAVEQWSAVARRIEGPTQ